MEIENKGINWELTLYVVGKTPTGQIALKNLQQICREFLDDKCRIEMVDLLQYPERAEADQIIAVPTTVRKSPPPVRKVIGSLSAKSLAVTALGLGDYEEQL